MQNLQELTESLAARTRDILTEAVKIDNKRLDDTRVWYVCPTPQKNPRAAPPSLKAALGASPSFDPPPRTKTSCASATMPR